MAPSKMPAQALPPARSRLCHISCLYQLCSLEPVATDSASVSSSVQQE